MSAPTKVPLKIYQGATFFESWEWSTAPNEDSPYTPVDLTGCTARMQIRAKIEATTPLLTLTTENGGIALDANGGIELSIDADDTYPDLTPPIDRDGEIWYHDLLITAPDGTRDRLYQGVIIVQPGITVPA